VACSLFRLRGGHVASKKEVVTVRKTILANTSGKLRERIKDSGTVEELRLRFYPGQSRALRVVPYILHKGEQREDLVTFFDGSDRYFSGDDDTVVLPCILSVGNDDYLEISYANISTLYDYTLAVDIVIDYYGGKNRVSGGVVS
jgi:hypothetical protein